MKTLRFARNKLQAIFRKIWLREIENRSLLALILFNLFVMKLLLTYVPVGWTKLVSHLFALALALLQAAWSGNRLLRLRFEFGAQIVSAPGSATGRLIAVLYSKKKYDAIFSQAIADMREEYFEALTAGNTKHAKWIWIRGIGSIWMAVFADIPVSAIKLTVKLWKAAQ